MKKIFGLMILSLLIISVGLSGAYMVDTPVYVNGKILYNGDINDPAEEAEVIVYCNNYFRENVSSKYGSYAVSFLHSECSDGDLVIVYATKGDLSGENSGFVENNLVPGLEIAIVNVPLVPEFGFFMGTLTLLSAMVVFFVIRRD